MALFLGLCLGHILGDFVFQPGRLVVAKRQHLSAALLHSAIVTACTALVLASSLEWVWHAVIIAGGAHLCVEELTIRARRIPESSNLTVFLLDQGLHLVSLAVIAALASVPIEPAIALWPVTLYALAAICAIVTVAFGGSILVFEVQLARVRPGNGPDPILALDGARVYGLVERGGALVGGLLLPIPLLGMLAFAPRVLYALRVPRDRRRHELVAVWVGSALCLVAWVFVSLVGALP